MTGQLDMKEFFELIKYYQVFFHLAGGDDLQDPWKINKQLYHKYKKSVEGIFPGFPTANESGAMAALDTNLLVNYEVNFKEFLIVMEMHDIFRK